MVTDAHVIASELQYTAGPLPANATTAQMTPFHATCLARAALSDNLTVHVSPSGDE